MKRIFLTIYVLIACTALFVIIGVTPLVDRLMTGIELEEERSEFRGIFALIIQDLESMPASAWKGYLDGLNQSFDYPITVVENEGVLLPPRHRDDFDTGHLVPTTEGVDALVKKISDTGYSLILGPLPELKNLALIERLILALSFVVLAIPVFAWSLMLWRDLSRLEAATRAFGQGDFSARATSSRFSSLSDLKETFNAMAYRIEKLIASHKELTNAVSHELRTPLSRIRFGMEMMKTGKTRDDRERYLLGIERDTGEIETLVDEMLTYARFDREPGRVTPSSHELVGWLGYMVACEQGEGMSVRLVWDPPASSVEVWFDPQYMAWAVRNLIRNALGHAVTEVRLSMESRGDAVSLHIDDDGPGVPDADRERIFEPFARLDGSRNRKSGGYGLGLAIAKRIAIAHEGAITVDDSPMGGARFTLSWPKNPAEEA